MLLHLPLVYRQRVHSSGRRRVFLHWTSRRETFEVPEFSGSETDHAFTSRFEGHALSWCVLKGILYRRVVTAEMEPADLLRITGAVSEQLRGALFAPSAGDWADHPAFVDQSLAPPLVGQRLTDPELAYIPRPVFLPIELEGSERRLRDAVARLVIIDGQLWRQSSPPGYLATQGDNSSLWRPWVEPLGHGQLSLPLFFSYRERAAAAAFGLPTDFPTVFEQTEGVHAEATGAGALLGGANMTLKGALFQIRRRLGRTRFELIDHGLLEAYCEGIRCINAGGGALAAISQLEARLREARVEPLFPLASRLRDYCNAHSVVAQAEFATFRVE